MVQEPVLVVTPHPDDSESAAGGTIARWCAEGKKVVLVVCTDGSKGTDDRSIDPAALAETREQETTIGRSRSKDRSWFGRTVQENIFEPLISQQRF